MSVLSVCKVKKNELHERWTEWVSGLVFFHFFFFLSKFLFTVTLVKQKSKRVIHEMASLFFPSLSSLLQPLSSSSTFFHSLTNCFLPDVNEKKLMLMLMTRIKCRFHFFLFLFARKQRLQYAQLSVTGRSMYTLNAPECESVKWVAGCRIHHPLSLSLSLPFSTCCLL